MSSLGEDSLFKCWAENVRSLCICARFLLGFLLPFVLKVHQESQESLQKWTLPCGADSGRAVISSCDFPLSREQLPPAKNEAVDWNKTLGDSDITAKIAHYPHSFRELPSLPISTFLPRFLLVLKAQLPKGTTSMSFPKMHGSVAGLQ